MKNTLIKTSLVLAGVILFSLLVYINIRYFKEEMQSASLVSALCFLSILLVIVFACSLLGKWAGVIGLNFIVVVKNLSILHTAVMLSVYNAGVPAIFYIGIVENILITVILSVVIFLSRQKKITI